MLLQELEEKDFEELVINSKEPVCVKFYAIWCGPCRMLSQVMQDITEEKYSNVKVYEVDVDNAPKLAQMHGVMSIPTMIFYADGKPVESVTGFRNETELKDIFDKYIK
ncbi:MAG: thioredoxin [Clostridia bacterium]|nr:thioredoxin [Clostridia bacterium]